MHPPRYILEPYGGHKTRHTCPSCKRARKFSRYVDRDTGEPLSEYVGRCDREVNCGYHYTPRKFFEERGIIIQNHPVNAGGEYINSHTSNAISYIEDALVEKSLAKYSRNNFVAFLKALFSSNVANKLIESYLIGTSKLWDGATVFWQVDISANVRTGKIMLYDRITGHRIKKPFDHVSWVHSSLKLSGFNLRQCFFGEHLLQIYPSKPVAIVESEKTAIIASVYMPQYIWLATGSISNLSVSKSSVLKGRRVVLFPDLKALTKWKQRAKEIEEVCNCKIAVSDLLESRATAYEKSQGLDIVDFLIVRDKNLGWALSEGGYPIYWDMLDGSE